MDPREKSCSLKCLRIFFIVCNTITVLLSVIFVLIFIIKPTLMVYADDGKEISNSDARRALKLRVILLSMAIPVGCFTIFALFKDHVKFLWFSFAFHIVYSIGMFIFGIHWLELVPILIIVIVFGFYVQNLSTFQKSLRFDRNLGLIPRINPHKTNNQKFIFSRITEAFKFDACKTCVNAWNTKVI